jgi:DNA-binding XRE family transcriptional regulator
MYQDTPKKAAASLAIEPSADVDVDVDVVCRRIGKKLQEAREQSGRTRAQFAEACGVESSLIEKIEDGDVRTIKDLAYVIGLDSICIRWVTGPMSRLLLVDGGEES